MNKRVLLLLDNQTAVVYTYTNNLGRTVSAQATLIVRELWMWCLKRHSLLSAQHLSGKDNIVGDAESRVMKDHSDWMLNVRVFLRIHSRFPTLNVDLFASHLTY